MCGLSFWHPSWLQKFANSKSFLIVYGLLGTTQAMGYLYFVVTLTTIEKRFKIPSQTTGKIFEFLVFFFFRKLVRLKDSINQILLTVDIISVNVYTYRRRFIS